MDVSIDFRLTGTGWCECVVVIDGACAEITGSYLADCLGGLSGAAVQLLDGASEARFSFDEEPGEFRWILGAADGLVRVRILEFVELWGQRPDDEGRVLIDRTCRVRDFVAAVRAALERVLAEHGVDGYRDRWVEHDFPLEQLVRLRRMASETRD